MYDWSKFIREVDFSRSSYEQRNAAVTGGQGCIFTEDLTYFSKFEC